MLDSSLIQFSIFQSVLKIDSNATPPKNAQFFLNSALFGLIPSKSSFLLVYGLILEQEQPKFSKPHFPFSLALSPERFSFFTEDHLFSLSTTFPYLLIERVLKQGIRAFWGIQPKSNGRCLRPLLFLTPPGPFTSAQEGEEIFFLLELCQILSTLKMLF